MWFKKAIPNALTLANLLCGVVALMLQGEAGFEPGLWSAAVVFIFLAVVFDFLDGTAARALKVSSPIGKELDSLADVVSFGVAPAVLVAHFFDDHRQQIWGRPPALAFDGLEWVWLEQAAWWALPLFACYRLARFNVYHSSQPHFEGLTTTFSGLVAATVPLMLISGGLLARIAGHYAFVGGLPLLLGGLMISRLPMLSFKLVGGKLERPVPTVVFLVAALGGIVWLEEGAALVVLPAYLVCSAWAYRWARKPMAANG